MVGGDYVPRELKCLADDGRLVFIAFLRGPKTELDINELMRRRLTVTGSTLRPRPVESRATSRAGCARRSGRSSRQGKSARHLQDLPLDQAPRRTA